MLPRRRQAYCRSTMDPPDTRWSGLTSSSHRRFRIKVWNANAAGTALMVDHHGLAGTVSISECAAYLSARRVLFRLSLLHPGTSRSRTVAQFIAARSRSFVVMWLAVSPEVFARPSVERLATRSTLHSQADKSFLKCDLHHSRRPIAERSCQVWAVEVAWTPYPDTRRLYGRGCRAIHRGVPSKT